MSKCCGNCRNVNKKSDPKMEAQGYARCNLLEKWQYVAGWHTCTKWSKKS